MSSTEYFLGGDIEHVKEHKTDNEILARGSNTFVKRMMENFKNTFCFEPSTQHATIPPGYKTQLDTTNLCNDDEKEQYWQCIVDMQWAIALGRIYIRYVTVVLSRYIPAPCKVQISNTQHIYGYLNKYTSTSIKFNIEMPAHENFKTIEGNWGNLYSGELEDLPHSCQPPMVKSVLISSFVYANLMVDLTMRRY